MELCEGLGAHRIDVSLHQVAFLWLEHQVVPPEGHDAGLRTTTRDLRQPVRVQTPTCQHIATTHFITLQTHTQKKDLTQQFT